MRKRSNQGGAAAGTAAAFLFCIGFALVLALVAGCGKPALRGGSSEFGAGHFELAAQAFQQAITKNPRDAEAHLWLARSWSELGRTTQAIDEYNRAVSLKPSLGRDVVNFRLHYWRARQATGENLLAEALAMKPGASRTTRLNEAAAAFESARSFSPDKALTDYQLWRLYSALGDNDKAVEALDRAFRKAETDREAVPLVMPLLKERGRRAVIDNRYADAVAMYQQAARLAPDDPALLGDLATAYLLTAEDSRSSGPAKLNGYRTAAVILERVRKIKPDDTDTLFDLATARDRLGQVASADSLIRHYLYLKPRDADAYTLLADVSGKLERRDQARTAELAARALGGDPPVEDPAAWAQAGVRKFGHASDVIRTFSEFGVPDMIHSLKSDQGNLYEIWFYFTRGRVAVFENGAVAGAILKFGRSG